MGHRATDPINMGIGINGSQQAIVALDYTVTIGPKFAATETEAEFVFGYDVEAVPSITPWNGLPTDQSMPKFQWALRTELDPERTVYAFQLDGYHDLRSATVLVEEYGLASPEHTLVVPLDRDAVYYWRYLSSYDGGAVYADTSHAFAVYVADCCLDRVGDANSSGSDDPTIGDISTLIDHLFITEVPLQCYQEADINQSGGQYPVPADITIGDVSYLIDYLFITGESIGLPDCL